MGLDEFQSSSDTSSESADLEDIKTSEVTWSSDTVDVPSPIAGCLLGSATIKTYEDQSAAFIHETKDWDYLFYLKQQCPEIFRNSKIRRQENGIYYMRSTEDTGMYDVYNKWYRKGQKRLPRAFSLDREILLHWYIDMGELLEDRVCLYNSWMNELDSTRMPTILRSTIPNARIYLDDSDGIKYVFHHNAHKGLFRYLGECPIKCCEHKWMDL